MQGFVAGELDGRSFACLEGCGFCCTFQPEVSQREAALLRARLAPRPLALTHGAGRTSLALQNQCGACTLLQRRACQAYDLRPAHCRYFPFHVHFGPAPEVYVNYTCRGVENAPGRDLRDAFRTSVLATASADALRAQERSAREAYGEFERRARRAAAWGDVGAVVRDALRDDPFAAGWMERAIARAREDAAPGDMVADALLPFGAEDVARRPFYLAPDLRWLTFDGPGRVMEMDEAGALRPAASIAPDWDAPLRADLRPYLSELVARGVFAGGVFALVDDLEYGTTVEEATWWRLAETVADLAVRARVLTALGVPDEALAEECARFYDSAFLDSPTIGGFL